jgi:hypothetical protein
MESVIVEERSERYVVSGVVLGHMWGGGVGSYPAKNYRGSSLSQIEEAILQSLKDGSLDSGMGFQSLKGALMSIAKIETLLIGGKEYESTEHSEKIYGDLSTEEIQWMCE